MERVFRLTESSVTPNCPADDHSVCVFQRGPLSSVSPWKKGNRSKTLGPRRPRVLPDLKLHTRPPTFHCAACRSSGSAFRSEESVWQKIFGKYAEGLTTEYVVREVLLGLTICFAQIPESVAFAFMATQLTNTQTDNLVQAVDLGMLWSSKNARYAIVDLSSCQVVALVLVPYQSCPCRFGILPLVAIGPVLHQGGSGPPRYSRFLHGPSDSSPTALEGRSARPPEANIKPPIALHAAWIVGFICSAFGGRPGMVNGATGAFAAIVGTFIPPAGTGNNGEGVELLFPSVAWHRPRKGPCWTKK